MWAEISKGGVFCGLRNAPLVVEGFQAHTIAPYPRRRSPSLHAGATKLSPLLKRLDILTHIVVRYSYNMAAVSYTSGMPQNDTGLAVSELSKSVPYLLLYHLTVPELTLKPPLNNQHCRPYDIGNRLAPTVLPLWLSVERQDTGGPPLPPERCAGFWPRLMRHTAVLRGIVNEFCSVGSKECSAAHELLEVTCRLWLHLNSPMRTQSMLAWPAPPSQRLQAAFWYIHRP